MKKLSKWIGYEFASNFSQERFPSIKFENGLIEGSVSGYLLDIVERAKIGNRYVTELRYRNDRYEEETQIIGFTYSTFKKTFYDVTVLPK